MIGTRGVPARYGGFETAIEEVGSRLAARGHEVIVYCRNPNQEFRSHRGMQLVNLPAIRRRALETISHAGMSVGHSVLRSRPDVAVVFNSANAPYLPILKAAGIPVAVHVDGLEWKRAKWAGAGATYYRRAESWSVHWADAVFADAHGIVDHIRREYGVESTYIPYGADILAPGAENLAEFGIAAREYHLVVARFEPENHVLEIVGGYASSTARFPLVVVGSAPYADRYSDSVRASAAQDLRIFFLGAVWDQNVLNELYGNALSYLHGHSVGGTNPSLLRALGAGAPVTAHDNVFNREVTGGHGRFFRSTEDVRACVDEDEKSAAAALARGVLGKAYVSDKYRWDDVAESYEALCSHLKPRRSK
jgi:glycosyltransferase involved in cell wall biosynthesis